MCMRYAWFSLFSLTRAFIEIIKRWVCQHCARHSRLEASKAGHIHIHIRITDTYKDPTALIKLGRCLAEEWRDDKTSNIANSISNNACLIINLRRVGWRKVCRNADGVFMCLRVVFNSYGYLLYVRVALAINRSIESYITLLWAIVRRYCATWWLWHAGDPRCYYWNAFLTLLRSLSLNRCKYMEKSTIYWTTKGVICRL